LERKRHFAFATRIFYYRHPLNYYLNPFRNYAKNTFEFFDCFTFIFIADDDYFCYHVFDEVRTFIREKYQIYVLETRTGYYRSLFYHVVALRIIYHELPLPALYPIYHTKLLFTDDFIVSDVHKIRT